MSCLKALLGWVQNTFQSSANLTPPLRQYPSRDYVWCLVPYGIFPLWLVETRIIPCPLWLPGMFCLLLSSSTFFVFISFLTQMSRFTFSQVSRGFLYRSLEISLCSSLLSSTLPCKFCTSFFPLILYSVFSTQGYSCSILVSPPCALFWKFSLDSQLWYLQGTLHLFPFPWEISILHYLFSNIWKMFHTFFKFSSYLR